ncbi:hypothetical protein Bhyg_03880 [Pseudolycoriella hygida]|uniref:Uncharacterized protein n=1 Tax=Pseudolycoriella hygida TaxID=35572 RepID=A0A9Q0NFM9_9DIPT|nr:hypothetical protein Bhyg_03880 [Pseudolycoriella hygida]
MTHSAFSVSMPKVLFLLLRTYLEPTQSVGLITLISLDHANVHIYLQISVDDLLKQAKISLLVKCHLLYAAPVFVLQCNTCVTVFIMIEKKIKFFMRFHEIDYSFNLYEGHWGIKYAEIGYIEKVDGSITRDIMFGTSDIFHQFLFECSSLNLFANLPTTLALIREAQMKSFEVYVVLSFHSRTNIEFFPAISEEACLNITCLAEKKTFDGVRDDKLDMSKIFYL